MNQEDKCILLHKVVKDSAQEIIQIINKKFLENNFSEEMYPPMTLSVLNFTLRMAIEAIAQTESQTVEHVLNVAIDNLRKNIAQRNANLNS